jgi:hypothetical protein
VAEPPGANAGPSRGVRTADTEVQLGLTRSEIRRIWLETQRLLADVDRGKVRTF